MTLVDAGPLIALLDRNDDHHCPCTQTAAELTGPLMSTWPVLAEAMYVLGDRTGWTGQERLWRMVLRNDLQLAVMNNDELQRSFDLMKKYSSVPMDLADATLVAVAESQGFTRIFTIDGDFRVYRLHGRKAFDIVP